MEVTIRTYSQKKKFVSIDPMGLRASSLHPHILSHCYKWTAYCIKKSVPTSEKSHCVFVTKTSRLMMFTEIITILWELYGTKAKIRSVGKMQSLWMLKQAVTTVLQIITKYFQNANFSFMPTFQSCGQNNTSEGLVSWIQYGIIICLV
jgi:hypothetical protein